MANLNRQGYREIKLHMILVEAMGTIYKDYTDKPLQTLIWITIRLNTVQSIDTQTERTLQQTSSALIKTRYALQYNTSNNSQGLGPGATAHNPLTHINFFLIVCAVGGCLVRAPKQAPPLIMLAVSSLPAVFSFR